MVQSRIQLLVNSVRVQLVYQVYEEFLLNSCKLYEMIIPRSLLDTIFLAGSSNK